MVISLRADTRMAAADAMLTLGAGAALTAIAVLVPGVGRLFLDRMRAPSEAMRYAQSLFLERRLFRTRRSRGHEIDDELIAEKDA
jgi:hypothetical protein